MNILGDFIQRVSSLYPVDMDNEELNSLLTTIRNQGEELQAQTKEIEQLKSDLEKAQKKLAKEAAAKTPAKAAKAPEKPKAAKAPAKAKK
jgi:alpha-amylase